MSKKITIEIAKSTAYSLWDSDENTLVAVIVKDPSENDGDHVDVTEKVREMIREHHNAYSVDIESISGDVVLRPGGFGSIDVEVSILESDEEGEQPDLRTYEIHSIAAY